MVQSVLDGAQACDLCQREGQHPGAMLAPCQAAYSCPQGERSASPG